MVAHHASPGTPSEIQEVSGTPQVCIEAGVQALQQRITRRPGGCPAATCRPSGRRFMRAVCSARIRNFAASAGPRPTATSSTSIGLNPHLRSTPPCWCSFTGWRVPRAATTPKPLPTSRAERGLAYVVPHFRGCSGELNQGPRAYHSGDYEEIGWILARLREQHGGPLVAVGVSLGGNALMRWAGEAGEEAAQADQGGGVGLLSAGPGRRLRRHRARLQPAGLHHHVPAQHEAQGLCETEAAPGPVRCGQAHGRARSLRVRRHLHRAAAWLSAMPTTTTPVHRPRPTCTASAFPRWR